MDPRAQLGTNIRELRRAARLSQEELGERSAMHMTEISRLERGKRDAQLTTILRVARGLQVPAAALLAGIE